MPSTTIGPAPEQRRVYGTWFEGLLVRALAKRLTPELISDLRTAGIDLSRPLEQHYAAAVRLETIRLLRKHLFTDQSDEYACHALGRAAVEGFLQTLAGQALVLVLRLLGPRALMKRAGALMSTASNYISADAIERAPFHWEVRLEGADLPPAYWAGMLMAGLEVCSARNAHVAPVSHIGEQVVLSCRWDPPETRQ